MSFIEDAFNAAIPDAQEPQTWYLCLISSYQRYGGPEEGGWWQTMSNVVKYKEFPTEELAEKAAEKVKELAAELTAASQCEHGQHCLRQMDWLEARGLEADYLPENNGPDEYSVAVYDELPVYDNTPSHYE
jgi:hypothetical protein